MINIESFANRVIHLFEYRKSLQEVGSCEGAFLDTFDPVFQYLRSKMGQVAPNLAMLIGEQVRPFDPRSSELSQAQGKRLAMFY